MPHCSRRSHDFAKPRRTLLSRRMFGLLVMRMMHSGLSPIWGSDATTQPSNCLASILSQYILYHDNSSAEARVMPAWLYGCRMISLRVGSGAARKVV
jgi:hypothetical protein